MTLGTSYVGPFQVREQTRRFKIPDKYVYGVARADPSQVRSSGFELFAVSLTESPMQRWGKYSSIVLKSKYFYLNKKTVWTIEL